MKNMPQINFTKNGFIWIMDPESGTSKCAGNLNGMSKAHYLQDYHFNLFPKKERDSYTKAAQAIYDKFKFWP